MGFHVEINSILRSNEPYSLQVGEKYDFKKSGSRIFFDDIPIWLTRMDWTALAEIKVVGQTRTEKEVVGSFRVLHVYDDEESRRMTAVFRRMYSFEGEADPYFYLLESEAILAAARPTGFLVRDDLRNERFIHASPASQLTRVANKYYRDVKDLCCAVVEKSKVLAQIKYEPATGGVYPHVYGPLNLDAVVHVEWIAPKADGTYEIDVSKFWPKR